MRLLLQSSKEKPPTQVVTSHNLYRIVTVEFLPQEFHQQGN